MELAAVVVVPDKEDYAAIRERQAHDVWTSGIPPLCSSRLPIVGNDVVQTWTKRVGELGAKNIWLTSGLRDERSIFSALRRYWRDGVERFLVIQLKSYAEVDLADLLRFHCETRSMLTEAQDSRGQLGIFVLSQRALCADRTDAGSIAGSMLSEQRAYRFRGYAKRILSATERQELIGDALTGTCAMRPSGTAIQERVWIGEKVRLASSVRLFSPCYIGDRAVIQPGATIGPFASVENDCTVDCGTTVERSTVLPFTYLAPGLLIRQALVDGGYLEDLRSGAVADLQSGRLGRTTRPSKLGQHTPERNSASVHARVGSHKGFTASSVTDTRWEQL